MIGLLLHGLSLGLPAGASPGPFQAVLLDRAARVGARRALGLALVPLCSDPPVIGVCLLALAGLPGGLVRLLQLCGGALLIWLGTSGLRSLAAGPPPVAAPVRAEARAEGFWSAALVNLLNPNAWLFWSLVGGPVLAAAMRASAAGAALFLAGFYLALVGVNVALILAFGAVGRLGPRAVRALTGVSALAFLLLGLGQLWRGAVGG